MNNLKKVKIHFKHRPRKWDHIAVPGIRLEGKWLCNLGFKEGEDINVKSFKNKLVITLNIDADRSY